MGAEILDLLSFFNSELIDKIIGNKLGWFTGNKLLNVFSFPNFQNLSMSEESDVIFIPKNLN